MKLLNTRHEPYTSDLCYHSDEEKKYWSPKIELCSRIINMVELTLVEKACREASTLHVKTDEIDAKCKELSSRDLIFTPIYWVKSYYGYSHRHTITTPDDPKGICYGVVTRSQRAAVQFKTATLAKKVDHETIGQLLGYPPCCREFFNDVWLAGYVDPIWQQAINAGGKVACEERGGYSIRVGGYPECVAIQRYWGPRISFHLPCSFQCEETRKLAQIWLKHAEYLDPTVPSALIEILSLPTTWDVHRGAAVVNTPHYKGTATSVSCADVHSVYYSPI